MIGVINKAGVMGMDLGKYGLSREEKERSRCCFVSNNIFFSNIINVLLNIVAKALFTSCAVTRRAFDQCTIIFEGKLRIDR